MAKAASSPELQDAFTEHLAQTRGQVERLDDVFKLLGESPGRKKCVGMEGLLEEGKELIDKKKESDPAALDAALIGAAQKVEHYEIAAYGTARTHAQILGNKDVANLLQETLDEEGETDKRLTELAQSSINEQAAEAEGARRHLAAEAAALVEPAVASTCRSCS